MSLLYLSRLSSEMCKQSMFQWRNLYRMVFMVSVWLCIYAIPWLELWPRSVWWKFYLYSLKLVLDTAAVKDRIGHSAVLQCYANWAFYCSGTPLNILFRRQALFSVVHSFTYCRSVSLVHTHRNDGKKNKWLHWLKTKTNCRNVLYCIFRVHFWLPYVQDVIICS